MRPLHSRSSRRAMCQPTRMNLLSHTDVLAKCRVIMRPSAN
jgi:hypothetical protein